MRIRILGGGWYGCHLAFVLSGFNYGPKTEHQVELHELSSTLFMGASGNMPGRLHLGFHYPRSKLTRNACQDHYKRFMERYRHLTCGVRTNIYAIAQNHSFVDFENYCQSLENEVEFIKVVYPEEFGLRNVEGAVLTGERHTLIRLARDHFKERLGNLVQYGTPADHFREDEFDLTIDCTFCAREGEGVDRYEPCVTGLLRGPTHTAVTIMDGPFPSLYPWDPAEGISSLTSAKFTPLTKECRTYAEARNILDNTPEHELRQRCVEMFKSLCEFYPDAHGRYEIVGFRKAVRAMPLSGADARLVDVIQTGKKTLRIRASKLDAIFYAEDVVKEHIRCL